MTVTRTLLASLLALSACAAPPGGNGDDDAWRPFQANSPIFSPGGTMERQQSTAGFGSTLTIPRLLGKTPEPPPLREEDGNVWPDPEPPRTTLTDPEAVVRGVPNFQPLGLPPQLAPQPGPAVKPAPPPRRPGTVFQRPEGRPAVEGAGTEGVWSYGVPGRPGIGTGFPDGSGGRILVEPAGGSVIVPRRP